MDVQKRKKGLSAAKAAEGRWRTVRRKGGQGVLLAPDGREFEGTEGEVRAAAMTPERRRMLADAIRVVRLTTKPGTADRRLFAASRRREAILGTETDAVLGLGGGFRLPPALAIRAEAAARFDGMALDEWLAEAAVALVGAVADANGGELPLTRHERSALDRLARRSAAG